MGHTIFMTVFSSLVIVGMVLLIIWGMSNVDPRRKGYGQDHGVHSHSSEICLETLVWRDGADGEPSARKPGCVEGKPFGDRSINHGIGILTRLDASPQRQGTQLSDDLVLKEIARLIGCEANTYR